MDLKNKSVLITGGTGSFGKKFIKEVLDNTKCPRLVVYSRDELKQYHLLEELKITNAKDIKQNRIRFFIGDVRDSRRLEMAMKGIDYVVHAAALKQVPAAEYNPMECIKTNILGAQNIIDSAIKNNVEKVVALSTDKAANPINLYGATKLASDKLFIAANNLSGSDKLKFSVVRYGNVFGSRGSVVPLFLSLKEQGVTTYPVTDKRMTRFWITLDEGVKFVLNTFDRMQGGEIFVPKIPSVNILDVLEAIDSDCKYEEIGIRPGEKLHEVMCPSDASHEVIEFNEYYIIPPSIQFFSEEINYYISKDKKKGKNVSDGFEYNSLNNASFLTVEEIRDYITNYL
tara:strand:+ start:32720 stop:33745 length:1026 start_codon:yes stop_codon:yes gene_type:complete